MHRTFISTVIVTALTITGISSTMVQAGEYRYAPQPQHRTQNPVDPVAATIAGIVALAIIGKAIDNNGGFKKRSKSKNQHAAPQRQHKQKRAHSGHLVMTVTAQTVTWLSSTGHNVTAAVAQTSGTVMAMVMATSIHMVRATTVVVTNKS